MYGYQRGKEEGRINQESRINRYTPLHIKWASLAAQTVKNHLQCKRPEFDPWIGKISQRKEWPPTSIFLPEELHGQRSLMDYCPQGHKESDTTEQLTLVLPLHTKQINYKDLQYITENYIQHLVIIYNKKESEIYIYIYMHTYIFIYRKREN